MGRLTTAQIELPGTGIANRSQLFARQAREKPIQTSTTGIPVEEATHTAPVCMVRRGPDVGITTALQHVWAPLALIIS